MKEYKKYLKEVLDSEYVPPKMNSEIDEPTMMRVIAIRDTVANVLDDVDMDSEGERDQEFKAGDGVVGDVTQADREKVEVWPDETTLITFNTNDVKLEKVGE